MGWCGGGRGSSIVGCSGHGLVLMHFCMCGSLVAGSQPISLLEWVVADVHFRVDVNMKGWLRGLEG